MPDLVLIIRTADRSRKAEITVSSEQNVSEVLQAAKENWALPTDTDYTVVNLNSGRVLMQSQSLQANSVSTGDTLEIQPVLVAGQIRDERS